MKTTLRIILAIALWLIAFPTFAGEEYKSTFYTTNDGLPNNTVRDLVQDSLGYIWIASNHGLSRYDGYRFVNFDPMEAEAYIDPHFRDIRIDPHGFMWIMCGDNYVVCFDPMTESFVDYSNTGKLQLQYRFNATIGPDTWLWGENGALRVKCEDGDFQVDTFNKANGKLTIDKVERMASDHLGRAWIGTRQGTYLVEDKDTKLIIPGASLRFIIRPTYDSSLMILGNGDIYQMKGNEAKVNKIGKIPGISDQILITGQFIERGEWNVFTVNGSYGVDLSTFKIEPLSGMLNMPGAEVITDAEGDHWLHNHSGKVVYYNTLSGVASQIEIMDSKQSEILDSERINIAIDGNGRAWISTKGRGLFSYDKKTGELNHFTESSKSIPSDLLLSLMVDNSGTVWTGSEYTGLTQIESFQSPDILMPEGMETSPIRMVKRVGDRIMIADREGNLYRYDSKLDNLIDKAKYPSVVYDFLQDSRGREWVATRGSGIFVDGQNYRRNPNNPTSFPSNSVFSIAEDKKGRIWIGTLDFGLVVVEENSDGNLSFRRMFDKVAGRRFIRALTIDHAGNLWAGTDEGLLVLNPTEFLRDSTDYKVYSPILGNFASNSVTAIAEDRQRRMWIATGSAGVAMAEDISNINNLKFNYIGRTEGLPNQAVQSIVTLPYGDGAFVTTEYGISRINSHGRVVDNIIMAATPKANVYSPNSAIALDGNTLIVGSLAGLYAVDQQNPSEFHQLKTTITDIRHRKGGDFEIDFSTLDFSTENKVLFSYKLENYDKEWSQPSEQSQASYKNLPYRKYKFVVKAMGRDGQWGPETAYEFEVPTPWYLRPWMALVYLLAIVMLVFAALRLKKILSSRRKISLVINDSESPQPDELGQLESIIAKHIGNPDFTVDDFAAEMKMGRTAFFRKVKELTDCSPKQFLLKARMARAVQLLTSTEMSVAEISYKVGFAEPAYFNNSFKAQFGKTPGQYRQDSRSDATLRQ